MPEPAKPVVKTKSRPFLKWAGGKFRLTDEINRLFPKRKQCLVEPFVGAGAVFLNSNFKRYILADINPDLINLFNIVKQDVDAYILAAKPIFFHPEANTENYYYAKRDEFNQSTNIFQRSVLFLYLNRFGFNGLCRYNSKNEFNVPFGDSKTHYIPSSTATHPTPHSHKTATLPIIPASYFPSITNRNLPRLPNTPRNSATFKC